MTYVRRLVAFLYDFLVGDAWELFVGPILVLSIAWLLLQAGAAPVFVGGVLVTSVVAIVAVHLALALRAT